MRVLVVASECFPLIKTGGLADVAGALPRALARLGHEVHIVVPGYPPVFERLRDTALVDTYSELYGGPARILRGRGPDDAVGVFVIDAPHLFGRDGHPYLSPDGTEWWDNGFRFAALAVVGRARAEGRANRRAARAGVGRERALGRLDGYRPDVVHAHDWQAGLTPAYLALDGRPRPASVMTVHNLAFQGQMPPGWLATLGLPSWSFGVDGVEYYGGIGFLKAGVYYADQVTTVSPTYALEVQGSLWGMGMDGLMRARASDLWGIVNGVDVEVWNPAADPNVVPGYDAASLDVRGAHKPALRGSLGLDQDAPGPLLAVISRLTWQKGMDVLLDAIGGIVAEGAQLVVLGSGDPGLEGAFRDAAAAHPGRVACVFGHDEGFAHRLLAGADAVLVPSRFEPCGLVQLQGLRYGCVPVVSRTGGLVDTVHDVDDHTHDATGFNFHAGDAGALIHAVQRVGAVFADPERWQELQRSGMARDSGWDAAARRYVEVYERAIAGRE